MPVRCANCNEEMLGAVNRCWRCGHTLVANAEQPDLPPLRRRHEEHQAGMIAEAEIVDEIDELPYAESATGDSPSNVIESLSEPPPRNQPVATSVPTQAAAVYQHPAHHPTAATGGAIGSLILGVISLLAGFFTSLGMLVAIGGIGLGAWGASSNRRNTALVGMLLCCLAMLVGGFNGSVWVFENVYGRKPWEKAIPAEYEESLDDGWEEGSQW